MPPISRGFRGRARDRVQRDRLPPGQYETRDFPVLSSGPTPRTPSARWDLVLRDSAGRSARWNWEEINALPRVAMKTDIHCVTKWSKFGTLWEGVSISTLLEAALERGVGSDAYVMAVCDGGYTTNLPTTDLMGGRAMIALLYEGGPVPLEHGGPARLLVPHLYFWKSAKWVRELRFMPSDQPGFWESLGYHIHGDPWREQRYAGDP